MKKFNVGIKGVVKRNDGSVLLLLKNQKNPFWEVPGGRVDGDETVEQTLYRELREELPGCSNIVIKRCLCAHRLPKDIGEDLGLMLVYFEVSAKLSEPIELSQEHTDYRWVKSLDEVSLDGGTHKALSIIFK